MKPTDGEVGILRNKDKDEGGGEERFAVNVVAGVHKGLK